MIYILVGPIRSGKTSALNNWTKTRGDVDGLLCPEDTIGKRIFMKVKSKECFKLEVESSINNNTISVGPFLFLRSAFKTANAYLKDLILEQNHNYFIIDELGKLELKNQGLHDAANAMIPIYETDETVHLILVVRDFLLDDIIHHYKISQYQLLDKETLKITLG